MACLGAFGATWASGSLTTGGGAVTGGAAPLAGSVLTADAGAERSPAEVTGSGGGDPGALAATSADATAGADSLTSVGGALKDGAGLGSGTAGS